MSKYKRALENLKIKYDFTESQDDIRILEDLIEKHENKMFTE